MLHMFRLAAKVALPTSPNDARGFLIGCIGIRNDQTKVFSKNGAVFSTTIENYHLIPDSHAEGRILRKLDVGSTIYLARIYKRDYSFAMSMPCRMCQIRIKAKGVKTVYYTIDNDYYGVWNVSKDTHKTYKFRRN